MSILVQLEVKAKLESVTAMNELLAGMFPDTRAFDGCIDIKAYLNDDGHTYVFIEHWESKSHYEKYLAWREETGSLALLGALVQGPADIRYFEPVAA